MTIKLAIDWGHEKENIRIFNGKKTTKKMPEPSGDYEIYTENAPVRQCKPFLDAGSKIYRCSSHLVAEYREKNNIEKSHDNDVKTIWKLSKENPDKFREFTIDPVFYEFSCLYSHFKKIQKIRIALGNQLFNDNENDFLNQEHKNLIDSENRILKRLKEKLTDFPIYTKFLKDVHGINVATSAALIAKVAKIDRFPYFTNLKAYFGLHAVDGKAPKLEKGKKSNWNSSGKSIILGIIAKSFIKLTGKPIKKKINGKEREIEVKRSKYRDVYDYEKSKQMKNVECGKITLKHADNRAIRKTGIAFLKEFYVTYKNLINEKILSN